MLPRPRHLPRAAGASAALLAVLAVATAATGAAGASPGPRAAAADRVAPAANGWLVSTATDPGGRDNPAAFGVTGAERGVLVYRSNRATYVRRVTDGGLTWSGATQLSPTGKRVTALATAVNGLKVDVLQQAGGTTWLRRSGTGGQTWTANRSIPFAFVQPSIARGAGGLLAVIGYEAAGGRWRLRVSTDDGTTWGPLRTVGRWGPDTVSVPPSAVAISDDTIAVFFVNRADQLVTRRSTDLGATWSASKVLDATKPFEPLSAAVSGATIVLAYDQDAGFSQRLVTRRSVDGGATWSAPAKLELETLGGVVAKVPGGWQIVSADERGVWRSRTSTGGVTWSAPVVISTGHGDGSQPIGLGAFTDGPVAAFRDRIEDDDAIVLARH